MSESSAAPGIRSHITLALCTVLHAFSHAYGCMLVPLYLLMRDDLHLSGVSKASLIVTVYGLMFCLPSYPAGLLADRFNRKVLLGVGLLGNALAVTAMGMTRSYEVIMLCGVLAGLFGALFHPVGNALVPAHYPKSPGMAIGLLGIGSGIGFFAGPQFAGWRAQAAAWHWSAIGDWQRPLIEAGVAGVVVALIFLLIARETPHAPGGRESRPLGKGLRGRVIRLAMVLSLRDFSGIAIISLTSIYLQRAHALDAKHTGFIVGSMMLSSVIVSPLAVYLSGGKRRLPTLAGVMVAAGLVVVTVPFWSVNSVLWVLMVFMALQIGSYAVSDAAMLERVPGYARGRVVGLFLMIAGTFSSASPWVMGWWTDHLADATRPAAYLPIYATLGAMMIAAAACPPLVAKLGEVGAAVEPMSETMPVTAEPAM